MVLSCLGYSHMIRMELTEVFGRQAVHDLVRTHGEGRGTWWVRHAEVCSNRIHVVRTSGLGGLGRHGHWEFSDFRGCCRRAISLSTGLWVEGKRPNRQSQLLIRRSGHLPGHSIAELFGDRKE